jgi:hypothetical protein
MYGLIHDDNDDDDDDNDCDNDDDLQLLSSCLHGNL